MTSHEKRVNALMRLHGMTKAQAEKRAKQIEAIKSIKGVYPPVKKNPVQKKLQSRPKPAGRLNKKVFTVEAKHGDKWVTEGIFPQEDAAREYAHALDAKYGHKMYIRVTV